METGADRGLNHGPVLISTIPYCVHASQWTVPEVAGQVGDHFGSNAVGALLVEHNKGQYAV